MLLHSTKYINHISMNYKRLLTQRDTVLGTLKHSYRPQPDYNISRPIYIKISIARVLLRQSPPLGILLHMATCDC